MPFLCYNFIGDRMKNKNKLLIIYFLLLAVGVYALFRAYYVEELDVEIYLEVLKAGALLLIYIVPALIFGTVLEKKYEGKKNLFLFAIFTGAFITLSVSIYFNEAIENGFSYILKADTFYNWQDALASPYVEEILKMATAVLCMLILNGKNRVDFLLSGFGVGLGFQIMEDIGYIIPEDSTFDEVSMIMDNSIDRVKGALGSHMIYSAVFMMGLYYYSRGEKLKGLLLMLAVMVNHFMWNMPLATTLVDIISIVMVVIIFVVEIIKIQKENNLPKKL